jgi:hypothetical protein
MYVAASPVVDMPSVWTYAAWCRLDAGAAATTVWIAGNGEAPNDISQAFLRFKTAQDRFEHNYENAALGDVTLSSTETYPIRGRWHHVVGTRDAPGVAVLYVDGVESIQAIGTHLDG